VPKKTKNTRDIIR